MVPTVVVELTVLDETRWAQAMRGVGLGHPWRSYRRDGHACIVMELRGMDDVEAALSPLSGVAAAVDDVVIHILEPVAIATIDGDEIRVDRLWPRGRGRG